MRPIVTLALLSLFALPAPAGEAATAVATETIWLRHLSLEKAEGATRFRYIDKGPGKVTDRDLQYKFSLRFRLNLTPAGRTYLRARAESGSRFDSSWSYSGIGPQTGNWVFNLKSLYFGQRLGPYAEAQAGGLEFDSGAGSEATYADVDGILVGYRLRLAGAGQGWRPEKFSVTVGHVGDFTQPNLFSRFDRLGDPNYVQVLAQKKLSESSDTSLEFDSLAGVQFGRGAVAWKTVPAVVFDSARLEAVARFSDNASFGWAATLGKEFTRLPRWKFGVTYSHIPAGLYTQAGRPILLVGDVIALGQRVGPTVSVRLAKNLEMSLLAARQLDSTPNTTRWRGQLMLRYELAPWLNSRIR